MKKNSFCILCAIFLIITSSLSAQAIDISNMSAIETEMLIMMPRADKIIIKFRVYNGMDQYRRWNETKQCWVDPAWINM